MPDHPTSPRILWPPPGLEGVQGVLFRKALQLGFGSAVLALPLLASVTSAQAFNSPGAFGSAWWIPGLTSLLGLLIALPALAGLVGFFRIGHGAALHGIDLETILQVGADHPGDTAALIQGTRAYRSLDQKHRDRAIHARIWASLLVLSAAIWITVGWILALLLASRGLLDPAGVWMVALGPAAVTLGAAVLAKAWEGTALQGAFGPLLWNRWRNPGLKEAARIWGEGVQELRREKGERPIPGRAPLLAGTVSLLFLTGVATLSAVGFSVSAALGPVLATVAVPRFSVTARRFAEVSAIRYLRLPPTEEVSPAQAGEALQVLASAGRNAGGQAIGKDPVRRYENPFLPRDSESPLEMRPSMWASELFPVAAQGLTPEGETFLREVAAHPALQEFETLARAPGADILGGRFDLPLPEGTSSWEIPVPRFSAPRDGGHAMVARAVVQFLDGNPEEAELTLRTLLSAGLLLADESPTLVDALVGTVLAKEAASALEDLYELSGKTGDAERLRQAQAAAATAAETLHASSSAPGPEGTLKKMPETVLDETALRGLRWEYFHLVSGLRPCINPHQMVFGPDAQVDSFVREARDGLARYPAEEAVFQVLNQGWLDLPLNAGFAGNAARLARFVFGGNMGRCAALMAGPLF